MLKQVLKLAVACLFAHYVSIANSQDFSSEENRENHAKFAVDLYTDILSSLPRSVVISPYGAEVALTLAYMGASGRTAITIKQILHLTGSYLDIAQNYKQSLAEIIQYTEFANKMFLPQNAEANVQFQQLSNDISAPTESLDMRNSKDAVNKINSWFYAETKRQINYLVESDYENYTDTDTGIVLANGVSFKGKWEVMFPPEETKLNRFYSRDGTPAHARLIQTMQVTENFDYGYISAINSQVIRLPYHNSSLSLYVILSRMSHNSFPDLQKKLSSFDLSSIYGQLSQQKLTVSLPKFKVETALNMNHAITQLGLGIIFTKDANFSKLLKNGDAIKVSKFPQRTVFWIDEEGANSDLVADDTDDDEDDISPIIFNANHPFVYFVGDEQSIVLLIGHFE